MPKRVFFSYSHKDEALREELAVHLDVLRAKGALETWHARKIGAGDDWRASVERAMEEADVVLFLVSADFLASEYSREMEVRRALERHQDGAARVVPVLLRPCLWEEASFAHLAPLPAEGRPITSWPNRDEAWLDVARGVRELVKIEHVATPGLAEPVPNPPAQRSQSERWLRELEAAQARKESLAVRGEDVTAVRAKIVELKHKLRAGGQLQQNDSLGDGRYFLLRPLGRGGFATVWEADDRASGKRVAVKVLHPQLAADPSRRERFFRGARAMAKLDHPNVVRVLVPYEEDAGFFYFVMELVVGGDLHKAVLDRSITHERVVPLILSMGEALSVAHEKGFVHRDVSPQNILLDADGVAKLSDFDLVAGPDTSGGTRTGAMGKFLYAAPEIMSRPQDADARADVYGLAMTSIFCLHGKDLPGHFIRHPEKVLAKLDSRPLAAVLEKAISVEVDERYAGMRAFCDALRGAVAPARVEDKPAREPTAEISRASFQLAPLPTTAEVAPAPLEPISLATEQSLAVVSPPTRSTIPPGPEAAISRRGRPRTVTIAIIAALAGLLAVAARLVIFPVISAYSKNRELVRQVEAHVEAAKAIDWSQPPSKNLALLDPILERFLDLDQLADESPPLGMQWVTEQDEGIRHSTIISYVAHMQQGFVFPCKQRLEERLKLVKGDAYLAERVDLKKYLMLNDALEAKIGNGEYDNKLDIEWATGQYTALWFELVKPDESEVDLKNRMAEHVRYYFGLLKRKRATPVPLNQDLIAYVRKVLMRVPVERRYYDLYVRSVAEEKIDNGGSGSRANRRYPAISLQDILSDRPDVTKVLTSAMFEKEGTWKLVEGPYTERGHYAVLRNVASGIGLLQQDAWIVPLGPDETKDKLAAHIDVLAAEYEKKYVEAWQDLMVDLTVRSPSTLQEAVRLYQILTTPPWPYFVILRRLEDHTQWPTSKRALDAEWEKANLNQLLYRSTNDNSHPKTGLGYDFDLRLIGERQAVVPGLFEGTVAFGVARETRGGMQVGSMTVTPLAKYISRLDALRNEMQKLLDANEKATPNVMQTQFVDAAKETEALLGAQLMPTPDPKYKDPAPLLLPWLQNPLKVGTVRLPPPRLLH